MDWLRILVISITFLLVIFYLMNGYFLLYIINLILYPFSGGPAYLPTKMKWCKELRDNYKTIRNEYINYTKQNNLKRFAEIDLNQKSTDTGDIPWEILMLRVYNKDTNKIKHFPETYHFIKNIPGCTLAMFSVLKPGKKLAPHYGPSKSVLRYHLSLIVPKNNKECFITVNGEKHNWQEGSDTMFDDTYLHSAENNSDETRVVLFLDIKRKYNNVFLDWVNDTMLHYAQYNPTVLEIVKNTNVG
jgi:beta-hydroxylase